MSVGRSGTGLHVDLVRTRYEQRSYEIGMRASPLCSIELGEGVGVSIFGVGFSSEGRSGTGLHVDHVRTRYKQRSYEIGIRGVPHSAAASVTASAALMVGVGPPHR
jgi:hypothetical protein